MPGAFIGVYVRPNELLLIVAGFVVAMMIPTAGARKNLRRHPSPTQPDLPGGALLYVAVVVTVRYLHHGSELPPRSQTTNADNADTGFSGGIPYSSSPATYPRDIYEVLFNPMLFNAHGFGERVAALENTAIVVLILSSLRNLRMVPRAAFARPYVMLCAVYSATFIYTFAALGNLGLIERERTMMLPFMLVLLCIPRAPAWLTAPLRLGAAGGEPDSGSGRMLEQRARGPAPRRTDGITGSLGAVSAAGVVGGHPSTGQLVEAAYSSKRVGLQDLVLVDQPLDPLSLVGASTRPRRGSGWCSARRFRHRHRDRSPPAPRR